jgi:hypothetical protein
MNRIAWPAASLAAITFLSIGQLSRAGDNSATIREYLRGKPDLVLCAAYHVAPSDRLRDDLRRRNAMTERDWDSLRQREKGPPSSVCGILAYYGFPQAILPAERMAADDGTGRFDPKRHGNYDTAFIYADGTGSINVLVRKGDVTDIIGLVE